VFTTIKYVVSVCSALLAIDVSAQQLRLAPADPAADRLVAEALRSTPEIAAACRTRQCRRQTASTQPRRQTLSRSRARRACRCGNAEDA